MVKFKLPKSIGLSRQNKYRVILTTKKCSNSDKRTVYVGTYDTLEEALIERDKFIVENYEGLTKGYMPRGIAYNKRNNNYQASLSLEGITFFIGTYKTIDEAMQKRNIFINSLK